MVAEVVRTATCTGTWQHAARDPKPFPPAKSIIAGRAWLAIPPTCLPVAIPCYINCRRRARGLAVCFVRRRRDATRAAGASQGGGHSPPAESEPRGLLQGQ